MQMQTNFIEEILPGIELDSNGNSIQEICSGALSEKDIINLSGGIPPKEITSMTLDIEYETPGVFNVLIFTNLYYVSRTINFNQKVIFNSSMRVEKQQQGLGRNLLINQIISARSFGFTLLNANAAGNPMNGFYTWGRLGYTMTFSYKERFDELSRINNRKEKSLFELLKTEEGRNFWINNGFTWNGVFFVKEGSENIYLLKDYLKEKDITIPSL